MEKFLMKFITILATIFFFNIQVCSSLFCYSCFNTPNNIYPTALPCPRIVEFSLMNIIQCDDVHNSCVMFTEKEGDLEYPVSAGCSWRRVEHEKSTAYVRNCQNGRCENFCGTDYCRYKWP